jgi:hypothetical protein
VTDPMPNNVENKNVIEFVADGPTETALVVATTIQDSNAESATPNKAMKRKYLIGRITCHWNLVVVEGITFGMSLQKVDT